MSENAVLLENADLDSCFLWVNSISDTAIRADDQSSLGTNLAYVSGSTVVPSRFAAKIYENQYQISDQLAELPPPIFDENDCDYREHEIESDEAVTLSPGVYCDGLTINKAAKVTFEPGQYIINRGKFTIDVPNVFVTGDEVFFYLAGEATLNFKDGYILFLPELSGNYAGIVFFAERNETKDELVHEIKNSNTYLTGTFYAPTSSLRLEGNYPRTATLTGGCKSVCIVVNKLEMKNSHINWWEYSRNVYYGDPARSFDDVYVESSYLDLKTPSLKVELPEELR